MMFHFHGGPWDGQAHDTNGSMIWYVRVLEPISIKRVIGNVEYQAPRTHVYDRIGGTDYYYRGVK